MFLLTSPCPHVPCSHSLPPPTPPHPNFLLPGGDPAPALASHRTDGRDDEGGYLFSWSLYLCFCPTCDSICSSYGKGQQVPKATKQQHALRAQAQGSERSRPAQQSLLDAVVPTGGCVLSATSPPPHSSFPPPCGKHCPPPICIFLNRTERRK